MNRPLYTLVAATLALTASIDRGLCSAAAAAPRAAVAPGERPPAREADRSQGRLRVVIETDAGGDPDDEQSLVRRLLYANEWDIEGIIANRRQAREGENRNPQRTGLGIVRQLLAAYAECYSILVQHDSRYPKPEVLLKRTVAGYEGMDNAVNLITAAVDGPDPRPLWYADWGSDHGSASNNLKRALQFRAPAPRDPDGQGRPETMLTVAETCRQQRRSAFTFLTRAVEAHLAHQATPSLLPGV